MKIYFKKVSIIFLCGLISVFLTASVFGQNMFRKMMDFDGDGKADFAITRNVGGVKYWYILQTTNGFGVVPFGIETDENAPGDFDGDGKFDPAIYRSAVTSPGSRRYDFWILGSQSGAQNSSWTTNDYPNTVANQQDYDGDGKTDVAYTFGSSGNRSEFFTWLSGGGGNGFRGAGGTLVKLGDMTGDGKADICSFNSGSNSNVVFVKNFANLNSVQTIPFGVPGDQFVPADFDGDGKGDLTVFRQSDGSWWWLRSSDNILSAAAFGTSGDVPVPADYDGDGKTDLAIWRAGAQSYYWVYGSQVGVFVLPWGVSGDSVVHF
jgi:FG-GAP-like repeat